MRTNKADVLINTGKRRKGVAFFTAEKWYWRLWFLITNPFRYLFTGKIRY